MPHEHWISWCKQEFYEKRKATKAARIEEHREAHKLLGSQVRIGMVALRDALSFSVAAAALKADPVLCLHRRRH